MFWFIKIIFLTGLMVLSSLLSTTILSCISVIIEELKIVDKNKVECSSCILNLLFLQ